MEGSVNAGQGEDYVVSRDKIDRTVSSVQGVELRRATIGSAYDIQQLVNHFADRGEMLHRPLSEIYENLRDYFVVTVEGRVIACCALHINWADLVEIKALAVAEDWQRKGLGAILIQACLDEARELGLSTVYALTSKPEVFDKQGFSRVEVSTLPHKLWGECYRCVKFLNCDEVAMVYHLVPSKEVIDASQSGAPAGVPSRVVGD